MATKAWQWPCSPRDLESSVLGDSAPTGTCRQQEVALGLEVGTWSPCCKTEWAAPPTGHSWVALGLPSLTER